VSIACQSLYTDLHASCSGWSALGNCDSKDYKDYMNINCKKSCICKGKMIKSILTCRIVVSTLTEEQARGGDSSITREKTEE
jgi:hypothetical protein